VRARPLRLAVIGTLAGAYCGLLGLGGTTVIAPLLVLWLGYGQREALGTALAAVVPIAAAAAAIQGAAYDNVDLGLAVVFGVPGVVTVFVGVALQQRISERVVSLMFAAVLVAVGLGLLIP